MFSKKPMASKKHTLITSIGFWGSIASLIGLALVFLSPQSSTVQQTSGDQSQVIHAPNSTINIQTSPSQVKPTQSPEQLETILLTPNYMRLFGAIEVPLLMTLIGKELRFRYQPEFGDMKKYYSFGKDSHAVVSQALRDFWMKDWRYHNVHPLQTTLWKQLQGSHGEWLSASDMSAISEAGINLYYNSLAPTKADAINFGMTVDEDGSFTNEAENAFNIKLGKNWKSKYPGTKSKDIGFLFLIMENSSNDTLVDIEISFYEIKNGLKMRNFYDSSNNDNSGLLGINWPNPKSLALNDTEIQSITDPTQSSIKIASAAPGESFIWLISIYRADTDGLPLFYLTDVQIPHKVTASVNGSRRSQVLRKPYLLQAARVSIPDGWFYQ